MHKTSRWQQIQLEALINADPTEYTSVPCRCGQRPPPPLTLKGAAPSRRAKRASPRPVRDALYFFRTREFAGSFADSGFFSLHLPEHCEFSLHGNDEGKQRGGGDRREEGEVEGAHDVDFLTHSVPWDANCQQVCAFRASLLKCRPCSRLFSHT